MFAASHCCHAQVVQPLLIGIRLATDDDRVRKVAAIAVDHHGKIDDQHVARFEDAASGRATGPFRAGTDGEITVDNGSLACMR